MKAMWMLLGLVAFGVGCDGVEESELDEELSVEMETQGGSPQIVFSGASSTSSGPVFTNPSGGGQVKDIVDIQCDHGDFVCFADLVTKCQGNRKVICDSEVCWCYNY